MYTPDFETFTKLAKEGNLIPIYREILADMETPVTALIKLADRPHLFLLESVEGGEKWGRYSFLGADLLAIFRVRDNEIVIEENGTVQRRPHGGDPLRILKEFLGRYQPVPVQGLPRFSGGAVGFLGYDMVRYFEKLPSAAAGGVPTDDAVFIITDSLVIFDNVRHTIKVVACAVTEGEEDLRPVYEKALRRIDAMTDLLRAPRPAKPAAAIRKDALPFRPDMTQEAFQSMVVKAKEYIAAGDIIQVVLSQRFQRDSTADPVDLYRALRHINPSPYLFFLRLQEMHLIGSSPEVMVRLEEGI
ncbi:MAG: anthranilate synthase component I, partial [Syntrophus sp. (in: bacteria)]|nr:anthranilate synthase component I [Syntrophus sp. (in: bacteria)]